MNLRRQCQHLLAILDPVEKARLVTALDRSAAIDTDEQIEAVNGLPGRSERPPLVPHTQIKQGSLATPRGHAALVHSIVHIERNAIEMASSLRHVYHDMKFLEKNRKTHLRRMNAV
jgi:uncharacterized ferritin-like protein (DUF455 family)